MIKRLIDDSTESNYRKYKKQSRNEQNVENKVSADIEKNNDIKVIKSKPINIDLLTIEEVCEILKVKDRTLEKWRITGCGPKYVKLTPKLVRYRLKDIEEFIDNKTIQNTGQRP